MADEGYQPFPDISAWTAVPFDPATYDQYAALLEEARADATEEAREHAVKTAMRYAGTDTGAIEGLYTTDRGFTRTVAIEAAGWEAAANERGPNAAEVIKDQIAAYEWVLDLVTQERPVTEHVIRELHAMLCRSQDTFVVHTEVGPQERALPKGEYKTHPNNPTSLATGRVHHYAPPDMVSPEMGRLVGSLTTEEYRNAHPVVQAAYLHYALAAIHAFADGNGRVARALASVPLYRAIGIPLVVLHDMRDEYLDALAAADGGALGTFVTFIGERVVDAIELVRLTVRAGRRGADARSIERLRDVVTSAGGLTHVELDAVANRLLDTAQVEFDAATAAVALPPGVSLSVLMQAVGVPTDAGYRMPVANRRMLRVVATYDGPPAASAAADIRTVIATVGGREPLAIEHVGGALTEFSLREVDPFVREVARIKLATFADEVLTGVLADLSEQAEAGLRRDGYLD